MAPTTDHPAPGDRPEADIVIDDGDCRLCTNLCHLLNRIDRGRLSLSSLQAA